MGKDLQQYQDKLRCGTCRNLLTQSSKVNVNDYKEDFVFVNCDDCQKFYEEHKQQTPGFVICTCDEEPKEIPYDMVEPEIKAREEAQKKEGEVKKVEVEDKKGVQIVKPTVSVKDEAAEDKKWDAAFSKKEQK